MPVILQKENVKTLSKDVFARIDKLTAPRLAEYWEQDPCAAGLDGLGIIGTAPAPEPGRGSAPDMGASAAIMA